MNQREWKLLTWTLKALNHPTKISPPPFDHTSPNVRSEVVKFLWQWKMATSSALQKRCMPHLSGPGLYSMLRRMREEGLIQVRCVREPQNAFWTLGKKGFHRVREMLPPLKESGHLSEHVDHDILVSAIHLGDGVFGLIEGLEFISEQQLRRMEPHHLPPKIPNCCDRRPDGYWRVKRASGFKLIALEVELHQKATSEYGSIARFYSDMSQVDRILWVTPTPTMARAIQRALMAETDGDSKHNFADLSSIYKLGWNARITIGPDQNKTVYDLLEESAAKPQQSLFMNYSLDTRITPYSSALCRLFVPEGFSY